MQVKTIKKDFDINLAKDIQSGKVEGRIINRNGQDVRIICWDRNCPQPVVGLYKDSKGTEHVFSVTDKGRYYMDGNTTSYFDLFIGVPECQPSTDDLHTFDKVLVRVDGGIWEANFFSRYLDDRDYPYVVINGYSYPQCIPFTEETKYLLGTYQNYNG